MCEVIVLFDGYSLNVDDATMHANCTCTLIKGPKLIIVDTMTAWDRDRLLEALAAENIKPEQIDFVVSTHGHADHIGNNNLFLNAEHIVGHSVQRGYKFFEKNIKDEPYELCEGVKIISTPGHTAEDVTVLVNTIIDEKPSCIAITGDLFEREEDITNPSLWQDLGDERLRKTQSLMRSRVINLAHYIVPGHGPIFDITETTRRLVDSQVIQ